MSDVLNRLKRELLEADLRILRALADRVGVLAEILGELDSEVGSGLDLVSLRHDCRERLAAEATRLGLSPEELALPILREIQRQCARHVVRLSRVRLATAGDPTIRAETISPNDVVDSGATRLGRRARRAGIALTGFAEAVGRYLTREEATDERRA